jgi:beta-lactamase superfamily II metal-dependent hydrolase
MLTFNFYESGVGETILIQFPSGGVGVIDAASPRVNRPSIERLVNGRHVHFVCLTHPHLDHGQDLVALLESELKIDEYWHTISHLESFVFQATEANGYPSNISKIIEKEQAHWTDFLIDLYSAVYKRRNNGLAIRTLHAQRESIMIDGVEFFFLAPSEETIQKLSDITSKQCKGLDVEFPDLNELSALIYVRYGKGGALLCSDAPKKVWVDASSKIKKNSLAKVQILKVPHHGSRDGLNFRRGPKQRNYLEQCLPDRGSVTVLFAGDSKHPSQEVFNVLKIQTKLFCVSNGLKAAISNSLGIDPDEGEEVSLAPPCIPHIQVELKADGTYSTRPPAACTLCDVI